MDRRELFSAVLIPTLKFDFHISKQYFCKDLAAEVRTIDSTREVVRTKRQTADLM